MCLNSVTDVGIGHLAQLTSLTRLDLSGSLMTSNGLRQLKSLPNLRSLRLYNLDDPNGYDGLKALKQLKELQLESVPISLSAYNKLEAGLPKTRVIAGHGTRWLWPIRDQK